jgi:ferredoxin, 2Fe-2S
VVKVIYVRPDGRETAVDAEEGTSVMAAGVANGVTELIAECGGTLSCATCHVYVAEGDLDRLGETGADENEMLDFTVSPREAGSRLSCQILLTADLDDLVVRVAPKQE